MTADAIRALLSHDDGYRRSEWRDFLKVIFPAAEIFAAPRAIEMPGDNLLPGFQLGRVMLADGRRVAFIEQPVPPGTDLPRNRVGLRNRVARLIDQESATGVLAVFIRDGDPNFRLSFVARESALVAADDGTQFTKTETAPKRFTYYLGPAEACTTAAQRFEQLTRHGAAAELSHLIDAFSVEKLNDEFFRDFSRTAGHVAVDLQQSHPDWDKSTRETEAQTLLNRLVFLYFVQRKGWLHRSRTFLTDAFRPHAEKPGTTFFCEFLAPLFECLSTEPSVAPAFPHDVPFLNGGLFCDEAGADDPDIERRRTLDVSNTVFRAVFADLLDRYNFTIVEDSPSSVEVAVDPEMLGRVFEAIVLQREESDTGGKSRRHDTGSHYTPRPIVHYLCREALAGWLEGQAPFAGQPDARRKIDILLSLDASEGLDESTVARLDAVLTPEEAASLARRLLTLRMCDPAVGSGAFPLGFLHELLNLLRLCESRSRGQDPADGDPGWLYTAKKQIIEQVIYGVDIQPPAIELCKLRLWLSLMVDHNLKADPFRCSQSAFQKALRQLEPLPNLDFKIRPANSLLDLIHGQRVRFDGSDPVNESVPWLLQLTDAKHRYFSASKLTEKRKLRLTIYEAYAALGEIALRIERNKVAGLGFANSDDELAQIAALDHARKELGWITAQVQSARREKKAATQDRLIEHIRQRLSDPDKPTFVWKLDFAEVFFEPADNAASLSGELPLAVEGELPLARRAIRLRGFDLHLGNPPYIRIQTLKKTDSALADYFKTRFHSASRGNFDLYVCFVERGMELLHSRGQLAYILPHKFFNAQYGQPLRELIAKGRWLRHVVHFGDQQIFPGATNYVCLLFLDKAGTNACRFVKADELADWQRHFRAPEGEIAAKEIGDAEWNFGVGAGSDILNKLSAHGRLKDISAKISQGIRTSANPVYVLTRESERGSLITARSNSLGKTIELEAAAVTSFLGGREIKAYRISDSGQVAIIPYRYQNGRAQLIELGEYRKSLRRTFAYLEANRKELEDRENGKMRGVQWHAFVYPKNIDVMQSPKLLVPDIADRAAFAFDEAGAYAFTSGYGITLHDPQPDRYRFVLAVLNSRVCDYFWKKISTPLRGGFYRYFTQFIEQLPIPAATPAQESEIVRLVEWLLWLHGQESVRTGEGPGAARDPLLAAYLEQWVNGLVYELFLPAELHAAGLAFYDLTATHRLPAIATLPESTRLATLRKSFPALHDETAPLRTALSKLATLPEVRLIEGRA